MCCHVTCFCEWCAEQLKKPTVEDRYYTPRTGCKLWPIMEMRDEGNKPLGKGYNDLIFGKFIQRQDSDNRQHHAALRGVSIKTGERYSQEIVEGNFDAYMVDGKLELFYVVEWEGEPWSVDADGEEEVDGHTYKWNKGEYLCRSIWLDKLHGGRNWYTMDKTQRQCNVKLEQVVNASVDLRCYIDNEGDNPLPSLPNIIRERAAEDGAWRMSDSNYIFLIEENRLREDNYEYNIVEANTVLHQERINEQWKSRLLHAGDSDNE